MTAPWESVEKIAERFDATRNSIYRWIDRQGKPAQRVGWLWNFNASEVHERVRASGSDESDARNSKDGR